MSALPASWHLDQPPPGAPAHWAHMPSRARRQWLTRQAKARADARPRDEQGRLIWSEEEQKAACNAAYRFRTGTGPPLTDEQVDARRAYRRAEGERRRRERGVPERDSEEGKRRPPRQADTVVAYVSDERIRETLTPRQMCNDLGMTPGALVKALERAERPDLAALFRPVRNADLRAARAGLPASADDQVAERRRSLDEPA